MALDENKRPIICPHAEIEEVEAEEYVGVCKKCGLRFKRLPRRRKTNG